MGAILGLLPQLLQLINNPAVQAALPLIQQLLTAMGQAQFPTVTDPVKAAVAASDLFDTNCVKWVQAALGLTIDGVYGQATKDAVSRFQEANGLTVDGWAGQLTQDALRKRLQK